jgi:16S rRNA (cytosine967-C5)-methyltransferase
MALRRLVLDIYSDILKRRQMLEETCARHPSFARYDAADRGFVMVRLKTLFRYRGAFMAMLRDFSPKKTEHEAVLHLALAEVLCLGTPVYAVAQWAKSVSKLYAQKYVHALIQRAVRLGEGWCALYLKPENLISPWLYQRLQQGYDSDTLNTMTKVHLTIPPLDITLRNSGFLGDDRAGQGGHSFLVPWSNRYSDSPVVSSLPGYDQGLWWVQDVAASFPVMALGDVRGQTVLDMGAAPGGKTMQLASRGAYVTALDYAPDRMRVLKENLARTGLIADVVAADALTWASPRLFDAVLLDAPCSATGTLRRHPELPWIRDDGYLGALQATQEALLHRALNVVKLGGKVVYAVCSLLKEEGSDVVQSVLVARADCLLQPITNQDTMIPDFALKDGYLQTNPSHAAEDGGMDGFFAACFVKTS